MLRGATMVGWTSRLIAMFALLVCTQAQGRGIFDFDEPPATTRPSTGTGIGAGTGTGTGTAAPPPPPAVDLRPGPGRAPADRYYLFPPISWDDATRGVLHLTTPPPVAPGAANKLRNTNES